jgi:hypothetical protein
MLATEKKLQSKFEEAINPKLRESRIRQFWLSLEVERVVI